MISSESNHLGDRMKLEEMSMKDLLSLYNSMSEKKAGPKTFASRARMIERIRKIAETRNIDLGESGRREQGAASERQPQAVTPELSEHVSEKPKKHGKGIGELARLLLMHPVGYPYSLIAAMVNAEISGAAATAKSVAWYASKMRKDGIQVPDRQKVFPADMNAKQSAEWLKSVRVVTPDTR